MAKTYAELIVYLHMDAKKRPLDDVETGILHADCENAKLQSENERLKQYKDYVEAKIENAMLPTTYELWNRTVEALAKKLEEHLKDTDGN